MQPLQRLRVKGPIPYSSVKIPSSAAGVPVHLATRYAVPASYSARMAPARHAARADRRCLEEALFRVAGQCHGATTGRKNHWT